MPTPEAPVVGDHVRFDVERIKEARPRADDTINFNSPMLVTEITEDGQATCTREGKPVGVWPVGDLQVVEAPEEVPPPIFPPDAITE